MNHRSQATGTAGGANPPEQERMNNGQNLKNNYSRKRRKIGTIKAYLI
jgi:hypothetical protein